MGQAPSSIPSSSKTLTTFIDETVEGAVGGLPVAEQNTEYFAVFKQVGGTGPEIIGQTAYFVTYLVDANGNVSKPADDADSLYNLIQSFPVGKNCVVRQDAASSVNSILAGVHKIAAIGRQQPILYTQTGFNTGSFSTAVSFSVPGGGTIGQEYAELLDYRGKMNAAYFSNKPEGTLTYFSNIVSTPDGGAATFNTTNGTYTLIPDSNDILDSITFKITFKVKNTNTEPYSGESGEIALILDNVDGSSPTIRTNLPFSLNSGQSETYTFYYTATAAELKNNGQDPEYYLYWYGNQYIDIDYINFEISQQNPQPFSDADTTGNFWTANIIPGKGSWLTGSSYLSKNYENIQSSDNLSSQFSSGYNLSPIVTPFKLKVGDRIRFEYNKQKEFYIYEIIEPNNDNQGLLKIRIGGFIPTGTETDNFVIHRTDVTDPAYIILDVDKNDDVANTQDFNGILFPQYPSKKLKNNLDRILIDLKDKGIITDNQS
jgi:hypothetical protein